MCNFISADNSFCTNEKNDDLIGLCVEHETLVCSECGEQAYQACPRIAIFLCDIKLCAKPKCLLNHLYKHHPARIESIRELEITTKSLPKNIVVARIPNGNYKAGFLIQTKKTVLFSTIEISNDIDALMESLKQLVYYDNLIDRDTIIVKDQILHTITRGDNLEIRQVG